MGSVRRRGDRVRVSLEAGEVALVLSLSAQVLHLLGANDAEPSDSDPSDPDSSDPDSSDAATDSVKDLLDASLEPVQTPQDPVLLRLLPDAYRDDGEAAGEFRRLTEADLRATKRGGLSQLVTDLTATEAVARNGGVRLDLDDDRAAAWLPALTDIRLALGTRIGVTEDMDDERQSLPVDSPRYAEIATYDWMSWLQDAMVRALTGG
jgi:hypothetical protein